MLAFGLVFSVVSCDKNGDDDPDLLDNELEIEIKDQVISQNTVVMEQAEVTAKGWAVLHKDNGGNAPVVPGIISIPEQLQTGESENVKLKIEDNVSIQDGEQLWAMLHEESGVEGVYEFNGPNTPDQPFMDEGSIVMKSFRIQSPSIDVSSASYDAGTHRVTITGVKAAVDGWLVIHNDDGTGNITLPDIIGKTLVEAGTEDNIEIDIDPTVTINIGQKLFPMLHIDNGTKGQYEFDGTATSDDAAEFFGNGPNKVIVTSFTVQ